MKKSYKKPTVKTKAVKTKAKAKPAVTVLATNPVEAALAEVAPPAAALLQRVEKYIVNAETAPQANEMLVQLKRLNTALEASRKSFTKPLKDQAKRIELQFKPTEDALERADVMLRNKLVMYRKQVEAEAEAKRAELLTRATEAEAAGDAEAALTLAQEAISQDSGLAKTVAAADGSVQVKQVWTFEVVDMAKVPPEFFTLDESKVRAAIRSGQRDIPGLSIFQREQVSVGAGSGLPFGPTAQA